MGDNYQKFIHEFQYKALVEATNALLKLVTVYFVIVGTSIGFLLSANIEPDVSSRIRLGLIIITILFVVVILSISIGSSKGLTDLDSGMKQMNPLAYEELGVSAFIQRGRMVGYVCIMACVSILIVIVVGLLFML